jgi:hypothetical protein
MGKGFASAGKIPRGLNPVVHQGTYGRTDVAP